MVTSIPFTEPRIRKLRPPTTDDRNARDYYKDTTCPGLQVAVFRSGTKIYYFVKRTDGQPTRHKLGTAKQLSVDQARKAAAAIAGKVATRQNPQKDQRETREEPTLERLHQHWMIYATARKKPRSAAEDRRNFERLVGTLAKRRLSTIKKADIQALHSKIGRTFEQTVNGKKKTLGGIYAANRTLALLRAMFNKAEELGYRGDNPTKGVKMFKEQSRDRFLQAGELGAFFTALETEKEIFRDFFLMSLLTAARKSNVLTMRWSDLDLTAGYWRIPDTKAGIPVVVALVAAALEILTRRRQSAGACPWVFPGHRKGDHLHDPKGAWERILTASKLQDLRPHDLRRSLGSWMAGQNVSLAIVGKVLGHKSPQATMIYARLAIDPLRQAMEGATTAMLAVGKQTKPLTVEAQATEAGKNG